MKSSRAIGVKSKQKSWLKSLFVSSKNRTKSRKPGATKSLFSFRYYFSFIIQFLGRFLVSKVFVVLGLMTIVLLIGYQVVHFISQSSRFAIRQIEVDSPIHMFQKINAQFSSLNGQNLFFSPIEKRRQAILDDPMIESIRIVRKIPDTLQVHVQEKHFLAVIWLDAPYLIDFTGHLVKKIEPYEFEQYPWIIGLSRQEFISHAKWAEKILTTMPSVIQVIQQVLEPQIDKFQVDVSFFPYITIQNENGQSITLQYRGPKEFRADSERILKFFQEHPIKNWNGLFLFITEQGYRIHVLRPVT